MEHSYKIWKDIGITQSYSEAPPKIQPPTEPPAAKTFIFDFRTKFKVKRKLDDVINNNAYDCVMLASESLSATMPVNQTRNFHQQKLAHVTYRLNEYSMPSDKIQSLITDALDFAEHVFSLDPFAPVVPIAVSVKVCTVQRDGETVDEAMDRSVRPDCLVPLSLVKTNDQEPCQSRRLLHDFCLFGLERVSGGGGMDACSICMGGGPTGDDGRAVSRLPGCGHAFHSHCLVRWLLEKESCPLCRQGVVAEKVRGLASIYARCDAQPGCGIGPGPAEEEATPRRPDKKRGRCDAQPSCGIGPGPTEEVETPGRPNKRQRRPSSMLKDYYVN